MNRKILLVPFVILLSSCGNEAQKIDDGGAEPPLPSMERQTNFMSELTASASIDAVQYYRNGIYINEKQPQYLTVYSQVESAAAVSDSSYSKAITQAAGVDESDRFHYNGEQIFLASNAHHETGSDSTTSDFLRILTRQDDNSLTKLSDTPIAINDKPQSISGLFVNEKEVSVITHAYYDVYSAFFDVFLPYDRQFSLSIFDASNLTQPQLTQQLTIDGHIISSRQIDNKIYLVSTFSPNVHTLIEEDVLSRSDEVIFKAINDLSIDDLTPHYTDSNGIERALIDIGSCLLPTLATEQDGYNGLVILSVIDTQSPDNINSTCVNADAQGIYVSKDSVYIYGSQSQTLGHDIQSVIHKFDITTTTTDYRASAVIAGHFGFSNSHLRFNEKDDFLTVVSTRFDSNYVPTHQLAVFKDVGTQTLDLVGQLPNAQQPEAIGKPNEQIYAVRYFNNKAYIVTFLRTDPLYVIDLSIPKSPKLEGALEIPGYSAYLHPISDDLLLGIGQNVRLGAGDNDLPEVEVGAQVSLFDISNPQAPTLLGSQVYEDSYTPVEFNYHALSYIDRGDGTHSIALPMDTWSRTMQNYSAIWQHHSSLELLEINDKGNVATLNKVGAVAVNNSSLTHYYNNNDARSVLTGDNVYYIQGNRVYHSLWSMPDNISGPFPP